MTYLNWIIILECSRKINVYVHHEGPYHIMVFETHPLQEDDQISLDLFFCVSCSLKEDFILFAPSTTPIS